MGASSNVRQQQKSSSSSNTRITCNFVLKYIYTHTLISFCCVCLRVVLQFDEESIETQRTILQSFKPSSSSLSSSATASYTVCQSGIHYDFTTVTFAPHANRHSVTIGAVTISDLCTDCYLAIRDKLVIDPSLDRPVSVTDLNPLSQTHVNLKATLLIELLHVYTKTNHRLADQLTFYLHHTVINIISIDGINPQNIRSGIDRWLVTALYKDNSGVYVVEPRPIVEFMNAHHRLSRFIQE